MTRARTSAGAHSPGGLILRTSKGSLLVAESEQTRKELEARRLARGDAEAGQ